jgi:predicted O-methyltransferase YrrM
VYEGEDRWRAVDEYFVSALIDEDEALVAARMSSGSSSMPRAEVAPNQGALLSLLARMSGARRVLEIGTLTGYSTIWLARAAAHVTTLEMDPSNAAIALQNLERAGVADRVSVLVGPALSALEGLDGYYDFVFLDADKPNNPHYLRHALRLTRPGAVIVADNVVRDGAVLDPSSTDDRVQGVRSFLSLVQADARLSATAIQTVGSKGWDGFAVVLRLS